MAKPNRVYANLPKDPMWEIYGWYNSNQSVVSKAEVAEELVKELRSKGVRCRVTTRGRGKNLTFHVMVSHKFMSEASRTKNRPTVDDIVFPEDEGSSTP